MSALRALAPASLMVLAVAGGHLSLKISGAKNATAEITTAGFCTTSMELSRTRTMHVFAFGANDRAWGISMSSSDGAPHVGVQTIAPADGGPLEVTVIDKTTGTSPAEWVRYEATSGSVTFTESGPTHVAGSFKVTAQVQGAAAGARPLVAEGTFSADTTAGCNSAARPR